MSLLSAIISQVKQMSFNLGLKPVSEGLPSTVPGREFQTALAKSKRDSAFRYSDRDREK